MCRLLLCVSNWRLHSSTIFSFLFFFVAETGTRARTHDTGRQIHTSVSLSSGSMLCVSVLNPALAQPPRAHVYSETPKPPCVRERREVELIKVRSLLSSYLFKKSSSPLPASLGSRSKLRPGLDVRNCQVVELYIQALPDLQTCACEGPTT